MEYSIHNPCFALCTSKPFLFFSIAQKSHFNQHARTRRLQEHPKSSLSHSSIGTLERTCKLILNQFGKLQTLIYILTLHQFENDITINGIRVKSLINSLIFLKCHHRVLTHRHIQIVLHTIHTQEESLRTTCITILSSVCVNANKKISMILISYIRTLLQRQKHIRIASEHYIDFWILSLDFCSKLLCHRKIEILLLYFHFKPHGSSIMSAMSSIYYHCKRHQRHRHCQQ